MILSELRSKFRTLLGCTESTRVRVLQTVAAFASKLPKNDWFYGYTIYEDGEPYLTRVLTPRVFGYRLMLHNIHKPDNEQHPHNHPWRHSWSLILTGGYWDERVIDHDTAVTGLRIFDAGDINPIDATDFHRIDCVYENTWTLFLAGERVQDWGFLVAPGRVLNRKQYCEWKAQKEKTNGG